MAEKKSGTGRWLLGCFGLLVVLALLCCCGGVVGTMTFPQAILRFFLQDAPLSGPTTTPDAAAVTASRSKACAELSATGETRILPDDLARWIVAEADPKLSVLRLSAAGDEASLMLSVATDDVPPRYLNLEMMAAFTLENGWFTDLRVDQIVLSGHDGSAMVVHQQLAQQANQSLANQRSQDPDTAALLDSATKIKVDGGTLYLKLVPGGAAMQKLCPAAETAAPTPTSSTPASSSGR